jgi:Tol biopolymer transport system component
MNPGLFLLLMFACFFTACRVPEPESCFPPAHLPEHITVLTDFGQRAEWSLDGKYVYFVDSAGGDVWRVNIMSKEKKKITKPAFRPEGHGYYRVLCLWNGDLLFTCGPERYELYMQVMEKGLDRPPVNIRGETINEGPAISRVSGKIAWSPDHKLIYTGRIEYNEGMPVIRDKKLIIDNRNVVVDDMRYEDILEPQNFRPPEETELIWSQYGKTSDGTFSSEVMGCNLLTGDLYNYSRAPEQYDEPEGIFPDGNHTLIESDKHNPGGTAYIDIYAFRLDTANPEYRRLTFFSEVEGFRSSNPVVRDDGKMIAFQASIAGSAAGAGCGLYLFDLEKFNKKN